MRYLILTANATDTATAVSFGVQPLLDVLVHFSDPSLTESR